MKLKETILEEHSKSQCDRIVAYIGSDKKRFATLMNLFFLGEYRVSQRAAWPMSYCVELHPGLIAPYLKKMIDQLNKKGMHDSVIRNSLRIMQEIDVPRKFHGKLMSRCFDFVQSNDTPVAIKAFALTILQNLSKDYPEILAELKYIIEDRWEHETAAFRSRARKILKTLQ